MRKSHLVLLAGLAGTFLSVAGVVACSGDDSEVVPPGKTDAAPSSTTTSTATATSTSTSPPADAGPKAGDGGDGGDAGDGGDGTGQGPGAQILCPSSGKSAFATYGASGFVAVNQAIFANVTSQLATDAGAQGLGPTLGEAGNASIPALDDALPAFEGKLAAFLVYAYGGPSSITYTDGKTYSGLQDMVVAHTGLNITPSQYGYFVTDVIVPALMSSGVTSADIGGCFAPLVLSTTFMQEIVGNGTSSGADLKCASSGKNAFATYGTAAFVAVNEQIFTNVGTQLATDAGTMGLGPSFGAAGTGMLDGSTVPALDDGTAAFKGKLAAFLVWGLGGPPQITYTDGKTYSGVQALTGEHTGLGLSASEYNFFVSDVIVPALVTSGVMAGADGGANDVSSCFAPVITDPNFVAQVVGH